MTIFREGVALNRKRGRKWLIMGAVSCVALGAASLSGCAMTPQKSGSGAVSTDAPSYLDRNDILAMTAEDAKKPLSKGEQARVDAIEQAGLQFAAQSGYCAEVDRINQDLKHRANQLDKIFNYSDWLLDNGRVLPPVIEEADASWEKSGHNSVVLSKTVWRIIAPAKIISTPPNWRTKLELSCSSPLKPTGLLLPKNSTEKTYWKKGVNQGWSLGKSQALDAFNQQLAGLKRDFQGMIRFHELYRRGIVSLPMLSQTQVGISVEGNLLAVDKKRFTLSTPTQWEPSSHWRTNIRLDLNGAGDSAQ